MPNRNKTDDRINNETQTESEQPLKAFIYSFDIENKPNIPNICLEIVDCNEETQKMDYFMLRNFVDSRKINIIFFSKDDFRLIYDIMWGCSSMKYIICIDCERILDMPDKKNKLMNKRIWNLAAINAKDDIECGGWMNSYTREKFSMQEISDFITNTRKKLDKYLNSEMNVLEIGCASGFTMYNIAPSVKKYVGVDMSDISIRRNKLKIQESGIKNIEVQCMQAHEISKLSTEPFDLIIMNSIVHCFEGYSYLFKVLKEAIGCLKNKGIIYLGDIMDLDLKEDFIQSLVSYSKTHGSKTKLDFSNELMLSRKFFEFLSGNWQTIDGVEISHKEGIINNELVNYRYDVILKIVKENKTADDNWMIGIKEFADFQPH